MGDQRTTRAKKTAEAKRPDELTGTADALGRSVKVTATIPADIAQQAAQAYADTLRDGLGNARAQGAALDVLRAGLVITTVRPER